MRPGFGSLRFNQPAKEAASKDGGRRPETVVKDAGDTMTGLFRGVGESFKQGTGLWGFGARKPGYDSAAGAHSDHAAAAVGSNGSAAPQNTQQLSNPDDDAAMAQYCRSLERLINMGYSPQAARAALQHLDDWLASDVGAAVMASAEAAARAEGENILHVGDRVRLEGLVKNPMANGKVGTLQGFGADSQRWKVKVPDDNKVYWIKPKLLTALDFQRPLAQPRTEDGGASPDALVQSQPSDSADPRSAAPQALAANWEKFEATQRAWREKQEIRELELLSKEQALKDMQTELEHQQQLLGERRRSVALETAKNMAQMEQMEQSRAVTTNSTVPFAMGQRPAEEFTMADDSPSCVEAGLDGDDSDGAEAEADADEMWDMDWSAMANKGGHEASSSRSILSEPSTPSVAAMSSPRSTTPSHTTQGSQPLASQQCVQLQATVAQDGDCAQPVESAAQPGEPLAPASFAVHSDDDDDSTDAAKPAESPVSASVASAAVPSTAKRPGTNGYSGDAKLDGKSLHAEDHGEMLRRKLEEKRLLAERHNGEDHTDERRVTVDKGEMPGVHPSIAEKLMLRRQMVEQAERDEANAASRSQDPN